MKLPLSTENIKAATALSYPELLRIIFPPQAVIHIGAGIGNGEMHLWRQWQIPVALILDADETRLGWATKAAEESPAWQIRCVVLAQTDGEVDYYNASNPAEDGLIPSEKLAVLWPNLRTSKQIRCQARRLDNLLSEESLIAVRESSSVWVLIDCLSALSILQGAGNELDRWSVLWLRVQLNPLIEDQKVGTLKDIEDFLEPYGYRCIYVAEGNHPAIGEAMFVRDWHVVMASRIKQFSDENATITLEKLTLAERRDALEGEIARLAQARDEQVKYVAELQSQVDAQVQESANSIKLANDRQVQIEALIQANTLLDQEKSMLAERRATLEKEVATLTLVRDEQARFAGELQSRIDVLTQERDSHATLANDRQAQIDALTQANTLLDQEKSMFVKRSDALEAEVAAVTRVRDEQAGFAVELQSRIDLLMQERDSQTTLANDRQARIEALTHANTLLDQEKSMFAKRRDALEAEVAAVTLVRDEQAGVAVELQSRIDRLMQECDSQTTLANDRLAQIEVLTQSNIMLNQEKSELNQARNEMNNFVAQHKAEIDQLQSQLQQKEALIAKLQFDFAENDARQRVFNDEMIKAEAQIDLIKDVLLRELRL